MPQIDVSEVLLDPDFATRFAVVRREEVVGENGRTTTQDKRFERIVGVVMFQGPSGLQRADDGQTMPNSVSVVTRFRLRGPSPGFQPDQIVYGGITFTISDILPFTRFGRGFVQATAISMNATNRPQA